MRLAAQKCVDRIAPLTSSTIIAEALASHLLISKDWRRWQRQPDSVNSLIMRGDVASVLADIILTTKSGPTAHLLRRVLKLSSIDNHLPKLFLQANQPEVRVVALSVLIDGVAKVQTGEKRVWISKIDGQYKLEPVFEERIIDMKADRLSLILEAAGSPYSHVRKAALNGLIRHFLSSNDAKDIARMLVNDKSPTNREKAAFILNH